MTTTEWVERYNQAFLEAGALLIFADAMDRSAARSAQRVIDDEIQRWKDENSTLGGVEAGSYAIGLADDMRKTQKRNERLNDPFGAIPPNPSPFEPKEVVDDGQEGIGALNQKE